MIKPGDFDVTNKKVLDKLEKEIDESIKSYHGWYDWEQAVVAGVYPVEVRRAIALKYIQAGWDYVYHKDIHNEECDGYGPLLTSFMLSNKKLTIPGLNKYECVTYDNIEEPSDDSEEKQATENAKKGSKPKHTAKIRFKTFSFTVTPPISRPITPNTSVTPAFYAIPLSNTVSNSLQEDYSVEEDTINRFISDNGIKREDIINIEVNNQYSIPASIDCHVMVFYWG